MAFNASFGYSGGNGRDDGTPEERRNRVGARFDLLPVQAPRLRYREEVLQMAANYHQMAILQWTLAAAYGSEEQKKFFLDKVAHHAHLVDIIASHNLTI